jgi:hypothetical protein
VGGGWIATDNSPYLPPHLPPRIRERGVGLSLSLRGGSGPNDPPARKFADALDSVRNYGQLQTVIYTDGSAVGGLKRGGGVAQL